MPVPDAYRQIGLDAGNRSKEKRKEKIAKGNPSSWRKVWVDALREHYPECVMDYPDSVAANLKRAVAQRGLPQQDMVKFLSWIVANWTVLRHRVFSFDPKKPRGPETPDMKIVIAQLAQCHALFMQQKPEIALALPLAQRRLTPTVPATAPKPQTSPAARPAPLKRPVFVAPAVDIAANAATRQRLGLKDWKSNG